MTPQPMVYDEKSTGIFVQCGCGRTFSDSGVGANNRYREWKDQHPCSLRAQSRYIEPAVNVFAASDRDAFYAALNRPSDAQMPLEDQMIARNQRIGDEPV